MVGEYSVRARVLSWRFDVDAMHRRNMLVREECSVYAIDEQVYFVCGVDQGGGGREECVAPSFRCAVRHVHL